VTDAKKLIDKMRANMEKQKTETKPTRRSRIILPKFRKPHAKATEQNGAAEDTGKTEQTSP
jgi:hypothetical protein